MTPDQLIYDYIFQLSLNSGYTTYDHLPLESENAPYPFVIIGAVQTLPVVTKNAVQGQIVANVGRLAINLVPYSRYGKYLVPGCTSALKFVFRKVTLRFVAPVGLTKTRPLPFFHSQCPV